MVLWIREYKMTELNAKKSKSNGKSVETKLNNELNKLEKIRDMLFGEQVEALQKQCLKLDSSLEKNVAKMREEMQASIGELKSQIEQNFKQLQKNISTEQADRMSQHEQINLALETSNIDMLSKVDLETKRLDEAISSQHEDSMRQLNSFADSMQTNKVDKTVLAKFLNDFASELENSKEK